jgi:predicted MFS family arabinose efflux permease
MQEKSTFTPYQKFILIMLGLLQFTVILDFMILSPLGDIVMKDLLITPAQFGTVVSAYAFSAGISGISAAGFADKYDRKKFLLFFYGGFVLGTLCCGLANNYWSLLAARIITGIFGGIISSIAMAIITDLFSIQQRGRVMGTVQLGFAGSQVLGIPIGLFIATSLNWHATFYMIVALSAIMGVIIMIKMKPVREHLKLQTTSNAFIHLWNTVKNRSYRTGFIATAFLSIGGFMLMPFGSAFMVNNILIPQEQIPIIFMFTGLASIAIMPVIGKLSDRIDKFRLFAISSAWSIIMVLIYTNLVPIPLWLMILVSMLMFMGIMGRMIPSTALATAIPQMKDRGAFMSINNSTQQAAGGFAALIAGLIITQKTKTSPLENYNILGYLVALITLVCGYLMYRVNVMVKKKTGKPAAVEV